jgi:hypothetical protein
MLNMPGHKRAVHRDDGERYRQTIISTHANNSEAVRDRVKRRRVTFVEWKSVPAAGSL